MDTLKMELTEEYIVNFVQDEAKQGREVSLALLPWKIREMYNSEVSDRTITKAAERAVARGRITIDNGFSLHPPLGLAG